MGKKKPGKQPHRIVPSVGITPAQAQAFYNIMGANDALSCVLIGASYLDNALGSLLENFLINDSGKGDTKVAIKLLTEPFAPLSTYSARYRMCYALGFYSQTEYDNLSSIGNIRNRFAHSHEPIDFEHEDIIAMCNGLKGNPMEGLDGIPFTPEEVDWETYGRAMAMMANMPAARVRFTETVGRLWRRLVLMAHAVQRQHRPTGVQKLLFEHPPRWLAPILCTRRCESRINRYRCVLVPA